jgi:hypothetical protein
MTTNAKPKYLARSHNAVRATAAAPHAEIAQASHDATRTIFLYFAGATHLMDIFTLLKISAFKVGVTGCNTVWARIQDLRRDSYGGILKRPDEPTDQGRILARAHEWCMSPIFETHLRGLALPDNIAFMKGYLALKVPHWITVDDVNRAVHSLLKGRCLRAFLALPENQALMAKYGHDPKAWFHTRYDLMGGRIRAAEELYLIQPKTDLPELVPLLGKLIERFKS